MLLALGEEGTALTLAESGCAAVAADDGYSQVTTYRVLGLARLATGDATGAGVALRYSTRAATPATYPLEYARSQWALAALLAAHSTPEEAAAARAAATAVLDTLTWPTSAGPPPEDLLTLARHEDRRVP